ncbi:MAG: saccharopine dehydrogenase [Halobacteriovoraceae bacterium]|jgi:saccharopine dehydrogenase (NAD+, L-lysine forming)|nr:saccharopine dehydrogenase [Halobacteriovoraceae bacterium]
MPQKRLVWLRHETKPFEERTALSPDGVRRLISKGHQVVVESSPARCFNDADYRAAGAELVLPDSWSSAPYQAIILGLKEVEKNTFPMPHRHIYFGHAYKQQEGAADLLNRFVLGDGRLFDFEFLTDHAGMRVCAFGIWSGFVGTGLALKEWALKKQGQCLNQEAPLRPYSDSENFIFDVKNELERVAEQPKILIIGARGRCGRGAQKFLEALKLKATLYSSADTLNRNTLPEALEYDIVINAVLLKGAIPPFLTPELLARERKLSVVVDISCDPNGPHNPLPIYNKETSFQRPVHKLNFGSELSLIAIDHLPSLLPRESSSDFESQFFPHLLEFLSGEIEDSPWERSLERFYQTVLELGLSFRDRPIEFETQPTIN